MTLDILHSDHAGAQRTPASPRPGDDRWLGSAARRWNLDHAGAR